MDRSHTNFFGGGDVSKPSITRKHVQETIFVSFHGTKFQRRVLQGSKIDTDFLKHAVQYRRTQGVGLRDFCRLEFSGEKTRVKQHPLQGSFSIQIH